MSVSMNSERDIKINSTWTVVKFIKDDSVEAIPTNWISAKICLWPRYTSDRLLKAIKTCEPTLSCWEQHEISTFRNATYGDYMRARKKCQKAEETSDLNSDIDVGRKIKAPVRLRTSSESSSNNSEIDICPPLRNNKSVTIPRCPSISLKQSLPEKILENVSEKVSANVSAKAIPPAPTRERQCNCCPEHSVKTNNDLLKQIIRKLSMVEITMADIRTEVSNINSDNVIEAECTNIWIEFNLPLKTDEELYNFEDFLKTEQNMTKSVAELSKLGGDTSNEFIRRAMQKLITNRLAAEYSWIGLKKKKVFSKLNIVNLLTVSARKNPKTKESTVSEIELAVKKFLRRSKERADAEDRKLK